jgi:transposase
VNRLLTMSTRELTRLDVMQRLRGGRLTQREAAAALHLSTREVKRLWKAYRREGERALVSRRRGRPPNNRLDPAHIHRRVINDLNIIFATQPAGVADAGL